RITEDEQFTVLGKIYKKDYDSFRTSLEQDREHGKLIEEIEEIEDQIIMMEKKIKDFEYEDPPHSFLYLALMSHTGVIIKDDKSSAFILDMKELRILELNEENKEAIWDIIEYNYNKGLFKNKIL
ncbi:hypothetical protein CDIK_4072, partial [Cucumispora dikerogammari]